MQYSPLYPHVLVEKLPLPETKIVHIQRPTQLNCKVVEVYTGCEDLAPGQEIIIPVQQLKPIPNTELGFVDASEDGANIIVLNP